MMQIDADRFGSDRYSECLPINAIKTHRGDILIQTVCRNFPKDWPELFDQRWQLEQGGRRLKVITPAAGVPLPDRLLDLDPRAPKVAK
jgi:hypothetical protein